MIVIVHNKSRKKSFRTTKRIISTVLPAIDIRINLGDIPERVLNTLIEELRKTVNRGTNIKIFIKKHNGFSGFKMIEIGKKDKYLHNFL